MRHKRRPVERVPALVCACTETHTDVENKWRHVVTELAPGLFVTGEPEPEAISERHQAWSRLGVEQVIDLTFGVRDDFDSHGLRVLKHPELDDGSRKPVEWFDDVVADARQNSTLIFCHIGNSCGPSAAFAVLLDRGYHEFDALDCIFAARPIATVTYTPEAMEWCFGSQVPPERADRLESYKHCLLSRASRILLEV